MPYHVIQVARPFDVVAQQVLELDEAWLEDAVRIATKPVVAGGSTRAPGTDPTLGVRVRVGWPCRRWGVVRLPMEWELTRNVPAWALRGELEVRQVSPDETRMAVTMTATERVSPGQTEQSGVEEAAEIVTRSFLQRLFWTLEALSRYDLLDQGGGRMARGGRGGDSTVSRSTR